MQFLDLGRSLQGALVRVFGAAHVMPRACEPCLPLSPQPFFCLVPPLMLWDPPYEHFRLDRRQVALKLHLASFQMSRPRHGILFEGLDPHLSKDGLFGKGTYLAEAAAKIDQYLKQDLEWRGNKPDHELQKLYEVGVKHATHVYYALVCRRALRSCRYHQDGKTCARPPNSSRGLGASRLQSAPAFRTFSVHK